MPDFKHDPRLGGNGRYRDANTGRIITNKQARNVLDDVLDSANQPTKEVSKLLREGTVSLEDWRVSMRQQIKNSHLSSAAAQKGGWDQMTQADFGRVGRIVRDQYDFLENATRQIESGEQRLDGTLDRRAQQYTQAGRETYHTFERLGAVDRGFTEERSVLQPADHCQECVAQDAKGWQPIGQMVPIGQRICLKNCRCLQEFRRPDGEMIKVDE